MRLMSVKENYNETNVGQASERSKNKEVIEVIKICD